MLHCSSAEACNISDWFGKVQFQTSILSEPGEQQASSLPFHDCSHEKESCSSLYDLFLWGSKSLTRLELDKL